MGDTNMCTDNPIILKGTLNSPTIICLQKKATKKIPTEADIIAANKLAFNDDIGTITNRVTSMFAVQANCDPDSEEYKTLAYRIMCGQHFQQCSIDRAKGVIAKPMPPSWYSIRDNLIKDGDDPETIERKNFDIRIAAAKKPYFMTYVYPKLKSENDAYIKNNNSGVARRFYKYGVLSIEDLKKYPDKTESMIEYLDFYERLMPVNYNPCIVNRISWIFEEAFKGFLSSLPRLMREAGRSQFDYNILKSGVVYSRNNYSQVLRVYEEYNRKVDEFHRKERTEKLDKTEQILAHQGFKNFFRDECTKICSNEDELCDIVLDICYQRESSKQFAWDISGQTIVKNLLRRNNNLIHFPVVVDDGGDFSYCGRQFRMIEKEVGFNDIIE